MKDGEALPGEVSVLYMLVIFSHLYCYMLMIQLVMPNINFLPISDMLIFSKHLFSDFDINW